MSRVLKLILGVALMGQAVMAQPAAQPPAGAPATGTPPASDADLSVRQRPTLSPQDMLNQAREYRTRMDGLLKQMQVLIDQARKGKDIIRLNCLTDKFAQLKANIAVADSGLQNLQDAIGRRDEGQSAHEYSRISIVHQKTQVLGAESQACVGEDLSYVGATRVDVEGGFTEDPTGPWAGNALDPVVDRPPSSSPML